VKAGMDKEVGVENIFDNLDDALDRARVLVRSENGSPNPTAPDPAPTPPA
jgi:hypothetical protein